MPDRKKLCQIKIIMPDVFFLCQMSQNYARSGIHYAKLRPLTDVVTGGGMGRTHGQLIQYLAHHSFVLSVSYYAIATPV